MPSRLRLEVQVPALPEIITRSLPASPSRSSALKKIQTRQQQEKMSLTQTYRIASAARNKLCREASRPDHNLRLLVGHANLLDSLMVELANAEREQEAWFNQTIRSVAKPAAARHVQWMDTVVETTEGASIELSDDDEYETTSDSDSDDDLSADDFPTLSLATRRRSVSPPPSKIPASVYEAIDEADDVMMFDDEADEEHTLTRVESNAADSVPALDHSDSEIDDSPLPSPAKEIFSYFSSKKSRTVDSAGLSQPMVIGIDHIALEAAQPMTAY